MDDLDEPAFRRRPPRGRTTEFLDRAIIARTKLEMDEWERPVDVAHLAEFGGSIGAPHPSPIQGMPVDTLTCAHRPLKYGTATPDEEGWWYNRPLNSDVEGIPLRVYKSPYTEAYYFLDWRAKPHLLKEGEFEWAGPLPDAVD